MGMFIVDQFSFLDEDGVPTGNTLAPQVSDLHICVAAVETDLTRSTDRRGRDLR